MPFTPIPSAVQVETRFTYFNQQIENVWAVQMTDPDVAGMLAVAAIFQDSMFPYLDVASFDITLREIFLKNLADENGPEATLTITPGQTGGVATAGEPGNVAFCVSLRSALAGRSFRGRKYFAGIPVGEVVANVVNNGFVDGCLSMMALLIDNLSTNATPLSIVSKTTSTITPVVAASAVDRYSDSMRSRLTGRGN